MGSEGRRRIGITEKPVNTFCKDAKVILFVSTLIWFSFGHVPTGY